MLLYEYVGFFVYFGLMVFVAVAFILISHLCQIRVKGEKYDWSRPYECGIPTEGLRMDRYPIHYYLVGILFVVFDVETVFFIPWAIVGNDFRQAELQTYWFLEMLVFLVILLVGYVFLVQKQVFNWGQEEEYYSKQ